MRPQKDATDEEHAAWAREYAESVMGTYRHRAGVDRGPAGARAATPRASPGGYEDDLISLAFAFENLMLAAREEGLGTVPITAFQPLGEGPPARDPRHPRGDRPGHRQRRSATPRSSPTGPGAGAEAQLPPVEGAGARRPLGPDAGLRSGGADGRHPSGPRRRARWRRCSPGRPAALVATRTAPSGAATAPTAGRRTLMVVTTIGHLAEAAWHHPDISGVLRARWR